MELEGEGEGGVRIHPHAHTLSQTLHSPPPEGNQTGMGDRHLFLERFHAFTLPIEWAGPEDRGLRTGPGVQGVGRPSFFVPCREFVAVHAFIMQLNEARHSWRADRSVTQHAQCSLNSHGQTADRLCSAALSGSL